MAKVLKYGDTTKVESGGFEQAPVGLYYLKCESIEQKANKAGDSQQYEVIFQPTKDANGKKLKKTYGRVWYYAPVDTKANWARRLKELVVAFGLKPKGGNLAVIEGKECMGRLREDTDLNGDYRPVIGKLMPLPDDVEEEDEDEVDEESNGRLDGLSRAELKKLIKDEALEIRVTKSMSDDELREAIAEQLEDEEDEDEEDEEEPEDEAEEDDEEDEEEEPEAEEDNYDDMSLSDLRAELADRGLETKGKKSVLVARLRTDDVEEPV